ncbi:hypothetical protein TL16_g01150 [Triparma laevis f. inornata]|uniref:F-box domain-containing protein n=1 Tax=Triparma laevis f. inornata TaxID=1714386 RepID=A0A9W6ZH79_9STRA|nr:hypothetical protein TL16_g01150 [Triparma laevis f. inornata]
MNTPDPSSIAPQMMTDEEPDFDSLMTSLLEDDAFVNGIDDTTGVISGVKSLDSGIINSMFNSGIGNSVVSNSSSSSPVPLEVPKKNRSNSLEIPGIEEKAFTSGHTTGFSQLFGSGVNQYPHESSHKNISSPLQQPMQMQTTTTSSSSSAFASASTPPKTSSSSSSTRGEFIPTGGYNSSPRISQHRTSPTYVPNPRSNNLLPPSVVQSGHHHRTHSIANPLPLPEPFLPSGAAYERKKQRAKEGRVKLNQSLDALHSAIINSSTTITNMLFYTTHLPSHITSTLRLIPDLAQKAKKYDRPSFTGVAAEMVQRLCEGVDGLFGVWREGVEGAGTKRRRVEVYTQEKPWKMRYHHLKKIASYLNGSDLIQCLQVCRRWRDGAFSSSSIWRTLNLKRFNGSVFEVIQQEKDVARRLKIKGKKYEHVGVDVGEMELYRKGERMGLPPKSKAKGEKTTDTERIPERLFH